MIQVVTGFLVYVICCVGIQEGRESLSVGVCNITFKDKGAEMAAYRISFIRSNGWTRLGIAGAGAALFSAPMLWALGSFGFAEEAIHRAIIFALSGAWCLMALGYLVGWALQGFIIRQKVTEEDSDDAPPAPASHRPPPAGAPPARGAPPPRSGAH